MDGMPCSVSVVTRTTLTSLLPRRAYSTSQMAAKMPSGVAMSSAKAGHQHGIDEGGRQRDILGVILPCEKLGLEVGDTHDEDVANQEHQHGGRQEGGDPHEPPQRGSLRAGGAAVLPAAGHKRMRFCAGHIGRSLCCGDLRHGRCPLSQG